MKCQPGTYTRMYLNIGVTKEPGTRFIVYRFGRLPADEAYREGDVHLVGGSHNWEGRVEIYWRGTWGTISDSSWSNTDARVVCSQLQHSISGMI